MPAKDALEIKGIRDGLLVNLDAADEWNNQIAKLVELIDQQREFFKGARLALDVGARALRKHELSSLQRMLAERGVTLWAVLSENMTTISTARRLELEIALETTRPRAVQEPQQIAPMRRSEEIDDGPPPIDPEEVGTAGTLVKRTLRSGRTVRSDGHVVIIGDVNPGSEIVAGGDVIIWGRLRGVVHAGAHGDEDAVVCALDMTPMQLRIAGHIATSPDDKRRDPKPEIAIVRDDRIVVESWN